MSKDDYPTGAVSMGCENVKRQSGFPSSKTVERVFARELFRLRYRGVLRSTIYAMITVAAIAVLIAMLVLPVLHVYGSSMSPTLKDGQLVVAVKTSHFKFGELVAFYHGNKILVKRCIAGPGQWVDIDADGNVYVDGDLIDEPYIDNKSLGNSDLEYPYQIPDGRWFMLGDHREISVDSRSSQIGCVAEEQIIGKIILRIWPLQEFGIIS